MSFLIALATTLITAIVGLFTVVWNFSRVKEKELFFENRRLKIELYRKFLISINKMATKTKLDDSELLRASEELLASYYELLPIASANSIVAMDSLINTIQQPCLYSEQQKAFNEFVREIRKDIKIDMLDGKVDNELPDDFIIRILIIDPIPKK